MAPQNLNNLLPQSYYVCYSESHDSKVQIVIETSAALTSPMGLVKEALKREISNMREFNARLDRQYPSLLQYAR